MRIKKLLNKYFSELLVSIIATSSGLILMFSTFSVENNKLMIATKVWSDFASHIPLIRSFSLGHNLPIEYPLFPGEPIKYHFVFYSFVGLLEKFGLRIDVALNLLSTLGFVALIFLIYTLAKEIFKSKSVGLISVMFFLFNSSLSFIYFLKNNPPSLNTISQIISNKDFVSFAPYGTGIITAFWNLNIFTNQRHLALSFALSLGLIYILVRAINGKQKLGIKQSIFLGILLGLGFYFHVAVFLMTCAVISSFFLLFSKIRKQALLVLTTAVVFALPQYLYLNSTPGYQMHAQFGYLALISSIKNVSEFWIYNLGLSFILIPLGFLLSNWTQRKVLLSFFTLFIIGNSIQFSPEIAANHKFFNYFLLIGNMFSALVLVKLWNKKIFLKPVVIILFFFMILGGLIDIFPIINDGKVQISDYKTDKRALWIKNNTTPDSVFLNTTFIYDPASIAGRKIFLGWPYFAWSQGYNTDKRFSAMKQMLGANDKETACKLLKQNKIDYIEIQIQNPPDPNIPKISKLYLTLKPVYKTNYYIIISEREICSS